MTFSRVSASPTSLLRRWWCAEVTGFTTGSRARESRESCPTARQGFNQYTNVITTYQNDGATPYLHLNNPYPNGLIQPAGNSLGLMNDVGFDANGPLRIARANRTPYEQSWSFGIEREVPGNIVINAEYIGKKGTHLPFSGSNQINHLGPWVENLPTTVPDPTQPCQTLSVPCLNNYVNNPFAAVITDPNSTLSSSHSSVLSVAGSLSAVHRSRH